MKKLRVILSSVLLILILALAGCQSKDETSLENKEVYEEELTPVSDEEMEKLAQADNPDEEMTALEEEELGKMEADGEDLDQQEAESPKEEEPAEEPGNTGGVQVEEDGSYTSKIEVSVYIHKYNKLPSNYITKKEAKELGWVSDKGNLDQVAPGKSIGGDKYGNYEGMLPKEEGRQYYECDIDFDGTYRNEKRIVYSNDGLIFYTGDHYKTFEQLY